MIIIYVDVIHENGIIHVCWDTRASVSGELKLARTTSVLPPAHHVKNLSCVYHSTVLFSELQRWIATHTHTQQKYDLCISIASEALCHLNSLVCLEIVFPYFVSIFSIPKNC